MSDLLLTSIGGLIAASVGLVGNFVTAHFSKKSRRDLYIHAALERRLIVHQEAFKISLELPGLAHEADESKKNNALSKHYKWWNEHCLFLSHSSRWEFYKVLSLTSNYKMLISMAKNDSNNETRQINAWNSIMNLPRLIEIGVNDPLISSEKNKVEFDENGRIRVN